MWRNISRENVFDVFIVVFYINPAKQNPFVYVLYDAFVEKSDGRRKVWPELLSDDK